MPIRKWKWLLLAALILLVAGWLYSTRAETRIEAMPSPPGESSLGIQVLKVSAAVDSLAWSPDSKLLAIETKPNAEDQGTSAILLWDVEGNQLSRNLYETSEVISSVAYSPDGRKLACGQWDSGPNGEAEVLMWDAYTGEQLDRLRVSPLEGLGLPFTSDILCVSFSPDGRFIAAGTKLVDEGVVHGGHIGGEVCMWDLEQGAVKWSDRQTHSDIVYAVAFSPDGKTLATAGMDTLIRVFETDSGGLKQTLWGSGWDGSVSVSLSPDSKWLAAGGNGRETGGCVRIWDLATGELKHTMTRSSTRFPKKMPVRVAFSHDGQTLFALGQLAESESSKWRIQMWEPTTGERTGVLAERDGSGRALAVAPNGELLAVGTYEGEIVLVKTRRDR